MSLEALWLPINLITFLKDFTPLGGTPDTGGITRVPVVPWRRVFEILAILENLGLETTGALPKKILTADASIGPSEGTLRRSRGMGADFMELCMRIAVPPPFLPAITLALEQSLVEAPVTLNLGILSCAIFICVVCVSVARTISKLCILKYCPSKCSLLAMALTLKGHNLCLTCPWG